jgi:phage baseplate assembly protein W
VAVKTLALSGGDLVIGSGGLQMISGAAKIRQDVALALGEEYGTDPYNAGWGSVLPQYVGQAIDDDTTMLVQAEVNRILQQYMAVQQAMLSTASTSGTTTTLTTSDVVRSVDGVDVTVLYDTVKVLITLTTMAGQTLSLSRTVTTT